MSIHVALHHRTHYRYARPILLGPQVVRLRPAPHCRTRVLSYSLRISPGEHYLNWQQDPQGNFQARLVFPEKTDHFTVEVDLVAEMAVYNPFDFFLEDHAEEFPFDYGKALAHELEPFLEKETWGPKFQKLLGTIDHSPRRTVDFFVDLNQRVNAAVDYVIRLEPGVYSPEETLEKGKGSCRDSAWLMVQLARHLGYAARFVSGYLIQLKADEEALDGPSGAATDFTDLHAWMEVYLPGAGWVGFDPTSGLLAGEGHLPLAATPNPSSAAPVTGAVEKCESELDFEMSVQRIHESPRVTKPYSEETWGQIYALGEAIDARLEQGDVRMTMGGEPTFVSIDDMEGAEWNTAAVGPTKRTLSERLLKRLWKRFGEGGFLHYGQGKWYPGESLPRWAYSCLWRKDGDPLWTRPELLANLEKDYGVDAAKAETFGRRLTDKLGVNADHLMPGYEDNWYYLWKERRLPSNVDPLKSNLRDVEERTRLAQVFEQGLDKVIGYVLPLERAWAGDDLRWTTGPWFLRPETLFLVPGDSPMGLRLPLDSLPWVKETEYPFVNEPDPMFDLPPLPDREALARQYVQVTTAASDEARPDRRLAQQIAALYRDGSPIPSHLRPRPRHLPSAETPPQPGLSAPWVVRTGLCLEPREGKLFVFMPPVATTEDYLDLLTAIEQTAAELDQPVIIEGYLPPHDSRLEYMKITPDPGVIEVNVHPSPSWAHLVEKTEVVYEEARQSRLGTSKYMKDGRHTGTGGGNHIVIGGERPSDSPLLRRPDLLRSLLGYWQHHPSLSYLFSGLFIGPTSQAPRLDEARHDNVRELEVAFREIERVGPEAARQPWLVDRIFRHLLTDLTGNTHRAEFCIDKLYSPDSATGRLGLLELRSFEMPPHARMSLVQHLLLRGLIAHFWEEPYAPRQLVDWGTDLHDRWMLPHFIEEDLGDVVEDLQRWGQPFEKHWFGPHLEFRFPRFGDVTYRGVELEIRGALEPWHVLGEETHTGGTSRYVDSSVERVQLKVRGLTGERYKVVCNGREVPLRPTGVNHEAVAGIRYRAWQPPSCLHPTIGIDAPLIFDLVDTWNGRSLGGCGYHVAHPGGNNPETFPVNAYEAESRRLARFLRQGHTPGRLSLAPSEGMHRKFPFTLDLREPDA
ncbi:MAG: DUF2126 domain-containing protein [Opitutales bacterium]